MPETACHCVFCIQTLAWSGMDSTGFPTVDNDGEKKRTVLYISCLLKFVLLATKLWTCPSTSIAMALRSLIPGVDPAIDVHVALKLLILHVPYCTKHAANGPVIPYGIERTTGLSSRTVCMPDCVRQP